MTLLINLEVIMSYPVTYHSESSIFFRFYDHARLAFADKKDIPVHEESNLEVYGDAGLWFVRDLPRAIKKAFTDPKVITVALTIFALIADSLLFYPATTWLALKTVISLIDLSKYLWAIKLGAYLASVESIIALAARALGRFGNEDLMHIFYHPEAV